MNGLNPIPGKGENTGGIEQELNPGCGASTLNIKVTHGVNEHQVTVPCDSSFGDLKSVIAQNIGLEPKTHKLLFRGKEKDDDDDLQAAGVKENSKVLIVEDTTCGQKSPEKEKETSVISRGGAAVAEVRGEVDLLSEQVSALQAVVESGTKVDDKDIIYLTEMLMRQLLKLDSIDAEGEGRVQRKMEVRRIQGLVEIMDILKSKNLNHSSNVNNTVPVTTQWETFEPIAGSVTAASQMPSTISTPEPSATPTPVEFPTYSTPSYVPTPVPSSNPPPMPMTSSIPVPTQFPAPSMPTPSPLPTESSGPMPSTTKVTQDWEQFN